MSNTYPRETVELVPVVVRVDGVVVTSGFKLGVALGERPPLTFSDPVMASGKTCVLIDRLDPGTYKVWAQVTSSPETPMVDCGTIYIT